MHDIHYKPLSGSDNIWSSICWLITHLSEANNSCLFFLFSESEDEDMTNVPKKSLQSFKEPDFYVCRKASQPVPFYTAPIANKLVGSHFNWSKTGLWKVHRIIKDSSVSISCISQCHLFLNASFPVYILQWVLQKGKYYQQTKKLERRPPMSLSIFYDWEKLLILCSRVLIYPWWISGGVSISKAKLDRLLPGQYLNNNIIEFGLKWCVHSQEVPSHHLRFI